MSENIIIYKSKKNTKQSETKINPKPNSAGLITLDHFFSIKKSSDEPSGPSTIETHNKCRVDVYCDGSTINNGKKYASGGIGVYFGPNDDRNISEPFTLSVPTNQKTELYALLRTLQILDHMIKKNHQIHYDFHIFTDSEYVINCLERWVPKWMTKDWVKVDGKPVKNVELLKSIASYYYTHRHIYQLHHVKAHTGLCEGNTHADELAVNGSHQHPNYKTKI